MKDEEKQEGEDQVRKSRACCQRAASCEEAS